MRHELGRDEKPVCLMDMGTIGAKWLKTEGMLTGLDESEEINACTVKCKVDVDGEEQDWLYLFKNETHNHPTEIEPFGGAATCVGGAIRDPLVGPLLRVPGHARHRRGRPHWCPWPTRIPGKLPQRKLVTTAAAGYSSYGNQIGLATGQVHELYHPGYAAKRMEIGAVVGATPADHVRRETPGAGRRGGAARRPHGPRRHRRRHGLLQGPRPWSLWRAAAPRCRRATRPWSARSSACSAAAMPCRMIKRCNDFGAGGVSVAIGELADGLDIDLDART